MKSWVLMAVGAICIGVAGAQAVRDGSNGGDGIEQTYNYSYTRTHEVTLNGIITGKVKGDPGNGIAASMMITVKTKKGKQYQVDLGPTWYVAAQTARLNLGDKIRVVGNSVTIKSSAADTEKVVIARLITRGRQVLALRDLTGVPYWNATRKGRYAIAGASNSFTGKLVSQNAVTVGNEKQVGYQLQTQNGLVNVALAPDWYLQQQGLGFHVGDDVTVFTGIDPARIGPNLVVADGLYGSGYGTVVLRPNGVPVWNGWTNAVGAGMGN